MADERRKLTFDPTVNAGHILTFLGFIFSMMVGWSVLDKRVVVLEEARKTQAQIDLHQDSTQQGNANAVRESLAEIKQGIRELNARLDARGVRQ